MKLLKKDQHIVLHWNHGAGSYINTSQGNITSKFRVLSIYHISDNILYYKLTHLLIQKSLEETETWKSCAKSPSRSGGLEHSTYTLVTVSCSYFSFLFSSFLIFRFKVPPNLAYLWTNTETDEIVNKFSHSILCSTRLH